MPVYVYRNMTTGATFEVEQRITEAALSADPATGDPVRRVIQPVGIAFKGSGFYVTDSRGKNSATRPAASTEAARSDPARSDPSRSDAPKSEAPKSDAPPPPASPAPSTAAAAGTD